MASLDGLLGAHSPPLPQIGLGTMGLGGRYERDASRDAAALGLLDEALASGIRLFDTAEVYGAGHGEELLGQALARRSAATVIVATKYSPEHAGRQSLMEAAKASLRRLGREHIDLYQMHWGNPAVPLEETLEALTDLVRQGLVRAVGLGNLSPTELQRLLKAAPAGLPIVSVQQEYSLIERFAERRLLPICRRSGLTLIAYSPLGQGALGGKTLPKAKQAVLESVAARYGLSMAQTALQWVARQPMVLPIPMTSRIENLRSNMAALDRLIDDADMTALDRAFALDDVLVPTDAIEVAQSHNGRMYRSLEEALDNPLGFSPSPVQLSEGIDEDAMLKPVKLRPRPGSPGRYDLFEGQLRYWAWVIAHRHKRPIPARIIEVAP